MRNKSIRLVVILATVSVLCLLVLQLWFLKAIADLNQKYIQDVTNRVLLNTANELFECNHLTYSPTDTLRKTSVKRFTNDTYFVNVGKEINPFLLEQFIIRELKHFDLNQDFEFEVFNKYDTIKVHRSCCFHKEDSLYSESIDIAGKLSSLPRNPKMAHYFTIYFPQHYEIIDEKVHTWYILDIFLILLMTFFGYTLYVVFRQRRLSEIQKNFVNNMTHEFKTPIAAIKLSTKVLEEIDLANQPERTKKYLQIINEQTQRLSGQVERILHAASLENKNFHLDFTQVDLNVFMQKTIHEFEGSRLQQEFKIQFTPLADKYQVLLDELHVSNVIYNILDNAIKYCEDKALITVLLEKRGKQVDVIFADNGIGIPTEYRTKIFNRFFRVPTGNLHDVKGFGLGLDYVKKIISFHHWKITVKENTPKGTRFIITLNQYDGI